MPVITASGLVKHIGGRTLFADLSFKLDRGERMTLSGRNGSGKTTLLRMLSGEAGIDAGTLATGKGVRIALHDQRPPRAGATLREYVTGGLDWIAAIEADLSRLEARMAEGARRSDAELIRQRPGAAGGCGRLPLARQRRDDPARPGLRRR